MERTLEGGQTVRVVRAVEPSEVEEALRITRACTSSMIDRGIYQWTAAYPSREALQGDLDAGNLYLCRKVDQAGKAGDAVGTLSLSFDMDEEYKDVQWLTSAAEGESVYVHRLAVHPSMQRRRVGFVLMDFAEKFARDKGLISVRLDTFSLNKGNVEFYEKRGYTRLNDVFFLNQSPHPFHAFELVF